MIRCRQTTTLIAKDPVINSLQTLGTYAPYDIMLNVNQTLISHLYVLNNWNLYRS